MRTVDIPGGQAVLRDQKSEITQRHYRIIQVADWAAEQVTDRLAAEYQAASRSGVTYQASGLTARESELLLDRQNAQIAALMVSWSRPEPAPSTADSVLDLDRETYQALLIASMEIVEQNQPFQLESFNPTPQEDGESPTGRSSDSEQSLSDAPAPKQTPSRRRGGTSTSTESSTPE